MHSSKTVHLMRWGKHLDLPSPFQLLIGDSGFPVPGQGKWRPLRDEASAAIAQ